MDRDIIEETYGIKCNFLEVMQIRNVIPWIRAGPSVVHLVIYITMKGTL